MEEEKFEDVESMLKLKYEKNLVLDIFSIFEKFSEKADVLKFCKFWGGKFRRKALRRAYKLYCKGLKELDKKVPVFVEVPKLEKQTEDQYKEVKGEDETIVVSTLPERVDEKRREIKTRMDDNISF